AIVPGLLRSAGVQPPGRLAQAEPVAQLRRAHWSTTTRDPLVVACKPTHIAGTTLTQCQDAGRVGPTLINVLITPYHRCQDHTCAELNKTYVYAWSMEFPDNQ